VFGDKGGQHSTEPGKNIGLMQFLFQNSQYQLKYIWGMPLQGIALDKEIFQNAKDTYYQIAGWPDGIPSAGKLAELGIDWVLPLLRPD
jgi:hypothetical protein